MEKYTLQEVQSAMKVINEFIGKPEFAKFLDNLLLTPQQTAGILKVKIKTMDMWRLTGAGPSYMKLTKGKRGLVRYSVFGKNGLLNYMENNMQSSTLENDNE